MGQETEDSQKLRRIAAAAYDYDNDPRWADYLSNILIPPHLSSRSDVLDHFKRKFYQRCIDPDLVVEVMSTNGSSQSMPSASSYSSSPPSDGQPRTRNTGSTARASGPSATAGQKSNLCPLGSTNHTVFCQCLGFCCGCSCNHSPCTYKSFKKNISTVIYGHCMLISRPRALNLQGIQVYLQSIMATKDFIYFIYCITFVTSHLCLKFALISILCRSLEHVAKFLRRNFSRSTLYRKYLEIPCVWVESNTTTLSILSSHTEIGLGFLLIVSLFSWQRNIIQTFMYWQLLKLMYHAPVTAGYHQSVWANIGKTINPLVHRHCPFLNTPLSAVQRWWLR
ncbi:hypothetical protein OIU77_021301 [Salix suchowensis]|uniref:Uncharacterized protein n=1 Tax=Salix suchowensis TaxID=1278906 RepID=A0ABQ9C9D7_9ROSI|nr:hypothetical protein OIU77_021301 [Salix suchowensis]